MFTHLHVHTKYSILDGVSEIPELVKKTKELGMNSLAITDHGVMYGCIEFYKECKKAGIKPIIGCEVYVCENRTVHHKGYYHLILLAENNKGYENLCKIVSIGFSEGFYYKPRVDYEVLEQYHEGIICLSGCIVGEVSKKILAGEDAKTSILRYQNIFGKDNFFLEIQNHYLPEEQKAYGGIIRLAKELNIPLVLTNDVHYINREDYVTQEIAACIKRNTKLDFNNRQGLNDDYYYLKSEDEMKLLCPNLKEAMDNTQLIADRCKVELEFHKTKLPKFGVNNPENYLKDLCLEGIQNRYTNYKQHLPRLEYELSVISQMGFTEYFLIVWDFINWARNNGISVGPGRGSCCGSIVAYSIGISDIDPIKYNLLFERFLNPERVSMPDIDSDFEDTNRERVIEYVKDKYGENSVVQISTMQTMGARAALKDAGRALNMPFDITNKMTKLIPKDSTLKETIELVSEFKTLYEQEKELIDLAIRLEGLPKSVSTHAAGVIICPDDAKKFIPLALNADKTALASQYDMVEIEELGLLKMDFLGLRTLSVIVNSERHIGNGFSIKDIPLDDPDTYKLIKSGKTTGVFQLESKGMQSFMRKLAPTSIEDIIAGVALYRPGPMDFIPQYIKNKKNPDKVKYLCPELEPILKETYGCIVYQEQVMQIFQTLAGYSLGQADLIRRAMSKKKQKVIDEEREFFINGDSDRNISGCITNNIPKNVANEIYDSMLDFAKYAFNKSHAAAYALLSYQTAYLKTHYKREFMAAVCTSEIGKSNMLKHYLLSAKKEKINLLLPDINLANVDFIPEKGGIRLSLSGIKGFSESSAKKIILERSNGKFLSINDFVTRLWDVLDKEKLENLILAGAFDHLPGNRHQKVLYGQKLLNNEKSEQRKNIPGQISLFDYMDEPLIDDLPNIGEYHQYIILEKEKEVSGVYLTGHPLDGYEDLVKKYPAISDIKVDNKITVCGMISDFNPIVTRKGERMATFNLEDFSGEIKCIIFPKVFARYNIGSGSNIIVSGRVSLNDDEESQMIVEQIKFFDEIGRTCWMKCENMEDFKSKEDDMLRIGSTFKGKDLGIVYLADTKKVSFYNGFINCTGVAVEELKRLFGPKNIKIVYS